MTTQQKYDSDDELDKLDEDITRTENKLNTLTNPEQIKINTEFDQKQLEKMTQQLKNLPKQDRMKLLEHLTRNLGGTSGNMFDHDFKTITNNSRENNKTILKEKLKQMKMKRTSKAALNNMMKKKEKIKEETTVEEVKQNITPNDIMNDKN
jgi:hypothetical protein